MLHPDVVSEDPVNYTPWLMPTTTVPRPRADAIEEINGVLYAAGIFDLVAHPGGAPTHARTHFVAFEADTGALKSLTDPAYGDPVFDGQIFALEAFGDSLFVGGKFTTVNGITRKRLVKIDAATGQVDTAFNARFPGGVVWALQMWNGPAGDTPMLIVGGSMRDRLVALDPETGADTGYIDIPIADPIPEATGFSLSVTHFAINATPTSPGTKLVATGNFMTVDGQSRQRLFVLDLTGSSATLDPWYYQGFAKKCNSEQAIHQAYLHGVDFSPDGTYFVVVATGVNPLTADDTWPEGATPPHSVCDAAGRFNLDNMFEPAWINYTGGDTIWATAVTGAAVYVQGHFEYLDNPARRGVFVPTRVERLGIGAIDPLSGKALPWDPPKPAGRGGEAFLATEDGLWVGSDSRRFNGERRQGIVFVPLP
jgi:hypothetical protein